MYKLAKIKATNCADCVHCDVCKYLNELGDVRALARATVEDFLNERIECTISCTLFKSRDAGGTIK